MIKLTWATTALLDLAHIRHYIARFNPAAASAVARQIVDIADLLANHPEMGVRTKREQVRRLVVRVAPTSSTTSWTMRVWKFLRFLTGGRRFRAADILSRNRTTRRQSRKLSSPAAVRVIATSLIAYSATPSIANGSVAA